MTVAYNVVTTRVGKNFVALLEQSTETTRLLKDLRYYGLRVLSSTSEYLLVATLEGADEAGPKSDSTATAA